MSETLPVSAIKNGTVIDHIIAGQAFRIIHLLSLDVSTDKVTIGLHLPSKRMGRKDLIKIESRVLTEQEANEIVVFSPSATINVIENFEVSQKIMTRLPTLIKKVFHCPNTVCITHFEDIDSCFYIAEERKHIQLTCRYCEKVYDRDQLKVKI
jgi:aspartate carbamoyltransferase regulatory subunit